MKTRFYIVILLLFLIFAVLSLLFAMQYHSSCQHMLTYHLFDMTKVFLKFVHDVVKDFSWTVLILVLFLIPRCTKKIDELIEKIGGVVVNAYAGKVSIAQQTSAEKKDFQKAQMISLKEKTEETEHPTDLKKRQERRNKLKKYVENQIQKKYDDFTLNTKLVFSNDPILSSGALFFDCSYRRMRRYINTLFIPNNSLFHNDRLYKYLRIMFDINKTRKNQRYAVEIVVLSIDDKSKNDLFYQLKSLYQEALDQGVLALKEYRLENDEPKLVCQDGWILREDENDAAINNIY